MKNISIVTMFKDSQVWHGHQINHVDRFFDQLSKLNLGQYNINKIYALYGHSHDNTLDILQSYIQHWPISILVEPDSNHVAIRSDKSKERLSRLSRLGDYILDKIDYDKCDIVWWIESDLIIVDNDMVIKLLSHMNDNVAIVTSDIAINIHGKREQFYDTLAFKVKPNDYKVAGYDNLVELTSCGSSLFIRADVLRSHRMNGNCLMGLCDSIYRDKYRILMDKSVKVYHPGLKCIYERWI